MMSSDSQRLFGHHRARFADSLANGLGGSAHAFRLDLVNAQLWRDNEEIVLRPKTFEVLRYLTGHPRQLVTKTALLDAVWAGVTVGDSMPAICIGELRKVLGDDARTPHFIETVHGRGYRFIAEVSEPSHSASIGELESASGNRQFKLTALDNGRALPAPRLSIVVLPFVNLGGDPEQEYFADGVTESLTSDLTRLFETLVIARNSAFSYKGKSLDVRQIGRELGVRYVLEGSVQRSRNRMRVNVQLVDAETGIHLWIDRFDQPVADLFDMQDEIVARLARQLDVEFVMAEARRAERSAHPDAMDLYFQGAAWLYKGDSAQNVAQARDFFDRALAIDPGSVTLILGKAWVEISAGLNLMTDDPAATLATAEAALTKALALAPNCAVAHHSLGVLYIGTKRVGRGIAECEHALRLDRNLALAHAEFGKAKFLLGRAGETEGHILDALRVSPRDFFAHMWMTAAGVAKAFLGRDEEAIAWFRRSIELNPNHHVSRFNLAASLAHLGRLDEARTEAQAGLALMPNFSIGRSLEVLNRYAPEYIVLNERAFAGMRMAGLK
jgi:TolB-like protein